MVTVARLHGYRVAGLVGEMIYAPLEPASPKPNDPGAMTALPAVLPVAGFQVEWNGPADRLTAGWQKNQPPKRPLSTTVFSPFGTATEIRCIGVLTRINNAPSDFPCMGKIIV